VQFERKQSFNDAPLRICPECRKKSLKKVISSVGIVFKGAGFYSTDHRASTSSSSTGPAKKDEKKEEKKDSTKDAKPAKENKPAEKSD
jgi:putative FmdB family regulatory protein